MRLATEWPRWMDGPAAPESWGDPGDHPQALLPGESLSYIAGGAYYRQKQKPKRWLKYVGPADVEEVGPTKGVS